MCVLKKSRVFNKSHVFSRSVARQELRTGKLLISVEGMEGAEGMEGGCSAIDAHSQTTDSVPCNM